MATVIDLYSRVAEAARGTLLEHQVGIAATRALRAMIDGGLWNVFEPIPGAELADQWADVHAAVQSALALQPVSDALVLQARQGFMDSVSAQ